MFAEMFAQLGAMPNPISNDEYLARQNKLCQTLDDNDLLILCSSPVTIHSNDVHHPYRTQSNLLYMTGWIEPDAVFCFTNNDGDWESHLFVQPKDTLKEIWEGRRPGLEGAVANWPIDFAHSIDDLENVLSEMIAKSSRVMHRMGIMTKVDDLVVDAIKKQDRARQRLGSGPISVEDMSNRIAEMRLIKSDAEIAQMKFASDVSSLAHIAAMRHGGGDSSTENQLQSLIEGFFRYAGTSGWSYPSIVGSGENATILHYKENNSPCKDGDIVLIDAGAEFRGYAADITRSWPTNGIFTEPQKELYQIVLDSQIAAINECVPGNPYTAPHEAARRVLAEGLIRLGIIDQSLDDALDLENGQLKNWYMHNTSHWIGLDVHDVGVYLPNGEPRTLQPGMCLTIEPGLYFGAWRPDVDCPQRYSNIGIRIEDDVLIGENGPIVLTERCPKTIAEIESIVGKSN
ncbi:MAG TPA: M24 family metallopeptidase [Candidatus Poseidoniaceae archaeon]|nr:MAG TPA: M24 family metallopeptidase [Candidatus Poseidoniales archaeon]HII23795.1 M24 family metallopeptidase [Candidatus Poseidoniaceae archaeon]|tara:strand:+ start:1496 stop:2869 length:1374 start_codon:yes stop_codon:yes gene_type:complete